MNNIIGILMGVLPYIFVAVVFYLFFIVPEKKRKKKYQGMIDELKLNDEVVTKGGIIGKITHIDEKSITLETSTAKTRIKFDKSAISYKVKAD